MVCGSSGGNPCSQAGVLVKFALISRAHAKITTTTASVHGGARSAPPCTQAVLVVTVAWARESSANFTRTPALVHGCPPLLPQDIITMLIIFDFFTPKIDSKFDSAKDRQKPDWRARSARTVLLMRAFVELKLESFLCKHLEK